MSKPAINVHRLSAEEQLELPLTEAQRQDLDDRLDELEREGPQGMSWDEALVQIRA